MFWPASVSLLRVSSVHHQVVSSRELCWNPDFITLIGERLKEVRFNLLPQLHPETLFSQRLHQLFFRTL